MGRAAAVPNLVILALGAIPAGVLGTLVLLARRRRRRYGEPAGRFVTDELDDLAELQTHAQAVAVAAEEAAAAADEAHHRTGDAVQALDLAGWHYLQVRRQAQAAGHPLRLVERAALNAYQRGQLSATELNQVWRYTQATAGGAYREGGIRTEWDNRLNDARQRYEQAAIEVTDVYKQAQVTRTAARVLTEEARVAESHLNDAQRSTSTGLAALFLRE
jgi:hypothetical protein